MNGSPLPVLTMLMQAARDFAECGDATGKLHIAQGDYDAAVKEIEQVKLLLANRVVVDGEVLAGNVMVVGK